VIALDDIDVHLGNGAAELEFEDVDVFDWITVPNSLSDGTLVGAPGRAVMSIDIRWADVIRQVFGVSNAALGFQGDFLETGASVDVVVENANGFRFAGSGDTSSGFAEIGHEQNGRFFGD
jgi:hypothetical protein